MTESPSILIIASFMLKRTFIAVLCALDRAISAVIKGGFGLKDVFTLMNLAGGVVSLCFVALGNIRWASAAVMLGYLGDVLDGPVARWTGRTNKFGSELDTIADHLAQCVAPAMVVFLAFRPISLYLALGLAAAMMATGSIRHARGAAAHFDFDLCWNGLPRPVGAFIVLSFLNSSVFIKVPGGIWIGLGLVVGVSAMNLVSLPFTDLHGRMLQWYVITLVVSAFVTSIGAAIFLPQYFWDNVFFWVFGYACTSWIPLSREERRQFFDAARRWREELENSASGAGKGGAGPSGAV